MIKLDISQALLVYLMSNVVFVLVLWALDGYLHKKRYYKEYSDYVWRCDICANVYVDSKGTGISICPQCGSYQSNKPNKL